MSRSRTASAPAMAWLAAVLLPSILAAQVMFQRTYGGSSADAGYSVRQTADGGYIIAGITYSYGAGDMDVYLIKTDVYGDTLWTRTFGNEYSDQGNAVRQTTDGGYIITGSTYPEPGYSEDVWLIKTDADGDALWTRCYGTMSYEGGQSVEQTTDSGYVIAGYQDSNGRDIYLVKTNAAGDLLWERAYGTAEYDWGFSAVQTTDGVAAVAGRIDPVGSRPYQICLVKTDADGDTLWTRMYGPSEAHSVQQTADGGYIVVAGAFHDGRLDDACLVRTDVNGDTLWTRSLGGFDGYSGQQTADGGCIVAGAGNGGASLIKTDANGETLWTRSYGGSCGYSVQQTADSGYILAGEGYGDVYLIKTDSLGNFLVGAAEPRAPTTRAPGLSLVCEPNPFRFSTVLHWTTGSPDHSTALLSIYDASGCLVLTRPVRSSSLILRSSSLPAGVYLARIDCGDQRASTRLVLQR
jgi:hypothetical protein